MCVAQTKPCPPTTRQIQKIDINELQNLNTIKKQINIIQLIKSKNLIATSLIAMLLFSLLISSSYIINSFYTIQFIYLLCSSIIIIFGGLLLLTKKEISFPKHSIISIAVAFLWVTYILINTYRINSSSDVLKSNYLTTSLLLYSSFVIILAIFPSLKTTIFWFICILAGIESLWCILQFSSVVNSLDSSFKVTGSWVNPNITAMFLALALPYILYNIFSNHNKNRNVYKILLCLIIIALLLLKCRTAILGSALATIIILELHFKFAKNFVNQKNKFKIALISILIISALVSLAFFTYNTKKDSADGRKLIWKLSLPMLQKKPLTGFGYGSFEQSYNIEQARYFATEASTENEKANAAHTQMAYNELLENTIEGGVIGGLFLILFTGLIFNNGYKSLKAIPLLNNSKNATEIQSNKIEQKQISSALVAIIVLTFMSFINFTITSTPLMCSFILFSSLVSSTSTIKKETFQLSTIIKWLLTVLLIITGTISFYINANNAYNQKKVTSAIQLALNNENNAAIDILNSISIKYRNNENYLLTLANLYKASKQKAEALEVYTKCTTYNSSPFLYQQIGDHFFEAGNYDKAVENYETASHIQPNRFTPIYSLLKLYVAKKDKVNATKYANKIITMNEKVPSEKTDAMKKAATNFLQQTKQLNEKKH